MSVKMPTSRQWGHLGGYIAREVTLLAAGLGLGLSAAAGPGPVDAVSGTVLCGAFLALGLAARRTRQRRWMAAFLAQAVLLNPAWPLPVPPAAWPWLYAVMAAGIGVALFTFNRGAEHP